MAKILSKAARDTLAATDWLKIDAMTDEKLARQIAANPDSALNMAREIDVRDPAGCQNDTGRICPDL